MYGQLETNMSRGQPSLKSTAREAYSSTELLNMSGDKTDVGQSKRELLNDIVPSPAGVSAAVSTAYGAKAEIACDHASVPLRLSPVLGAMSLRYLLWYSGMIISQVYSRQQLNAQKVRSCQPRGQDEREQMDSASKEAQCAIWRQTTTSQCAEIGEKAWPKVLLPLPTSRLRSSGVSLTVRDDACKSLIRAFEAHFFPSYLFEPLLPDHDTTDTTSGSVMVRKELIDMTDSTQLCSESELREVFQAFLKLGQQCAREAFEPPTVDLSIRPHESDGAINRDNSMAATKSTSQQSVQQKAGSVYRGMRQIILSLAFNCPCAPLAFAAKLILADALTCAGDCVDLSELLTHTRQRMIGSHDIREMYGFLSRLPIVSTSLTNSTQAHCNLFSPTSPPLGPQSRRTSDSNGKESFDRVEGTANSQISEVLAWEHHALPIRRHDRIFCFASDPHVQTLEEWFFKNDQRNRKDESAKVVLLMWTPCTLLLPITERLIMMENEDSKERLLLERALCRAVSEAASHSAGDHLHATPLRASRGRAQARTGRSNSTNAKATDHLAASKETTPPESYKPCADQPTDLGGGASRELQQTARQRQRQRQMLVTLSQSHILVPPSLRMLRNEILYGVFTETGDCPIYYHPLSLYPDLLRAHHASMRYLFFDNGPLPLEERLMLAIMVASRHRCEYLVCRFAALLMHYSQFAGLTIEAVRESPGDFHAKFFRCTQGPGESVSTCVGEHWLLYGPPPRLCVVQRFIALAAHTPWELNENDIRLVLQNGWTVPEVFQLTGIISHVLSLCSFVQGLFVPVEPWTCSMLPSQMLLDLADEANILSGPPFSPLLTCNISVAQAEMSSDKIVSHSPSCPSPAMPDEERGFRPGSKGLSNESIFTRYAGESHIVSKQRIRSNDNSNTPHTLRPSQFSWQDVGTTSMEHYYPGAGALLNEEIESFKDVVRQLTEVDCVSLKNLGFTPSYAFYSLQLYVMNLLGFMFEDYPYNDINKVLRRPAKWYAQALTVRPEALALDDVILWRLAPQSGLRASTYTTTNKDENRRANRCGGASSLGVPIAAITQQRAKQEADLFALQSSLPIQSMEAPLASARRRAFESETISKADVAPAGLASASCATDASSEDKENTTALHLGLSLQDERVLLLMATATMMARKEALLHLLLYPLCGVLSKM